MSNATNQPHNTPKADPPVQSPPKTGQGAPQQPANAPAPGTQTQMPDGTIRK